jgi:hypothetical protein
MQHELWSAIGASHLRARVPLYRIGEPQVLADVNVSAQSLRTLGEIGPHNIHR